MPNSRLVCGYAPQPAVRLSSHPIMCVERSAPRRVAPPPVLVAPHGLLSARFHVTIPPDDLWLHIRRYRHDTLTAADDRGHAIARLGTRHPASLSALRRATGTVHWQVVLQDLP